MELLKDSCTVSALDGIEENRGKMWIMSQKVIQGWNQISGSFRNPLPTYFADIFLLCI